MKRLIIMAFLLFSTVLPANAAELALPEIPTIEGLSPEARPESFVQGVLSILQDALPQINPAIAASLKICAAMIAVCLLLSVFYGLPGRSSEVISITAAVVLGSLVLSSSNSLIALGADTVEQVSAYGKLLLPVLAAALTAEGGVSASAAMYAGTAFFDAVLCAAVSVLLIPMIYLYLCLSICAAAMDTDLLKKGKDLIKWVMTWVLKIILYLFTGYIGITGVVSGSTDAAALKAAKLTISGAVPVVGGILSDASEAVLVGAGMFKNAAGIYGMLAVLTLWIAPFLHMGIQYLLVKGTGAVCALFAPKPVSQMIGDFGGALGMLVAMTGSVCFMFLISIVCFMRGVG